MAGSRMSPVLRDEWRGSSDTRDRQGKGRPRGSDRDRGRKRNNWKDRHTRPREAPFDRPPWSPPPSRSFPGPGREASRRYRESSPGGSITRGSPGPPALGSRGNGHRKGSHRSSNYQDNERHHFSGEIPFEVDTKIGPGRGDSPSVPPPSKRKRTRSPSPQPHNNFHHQNRNRPSWDRGNQDRGDRERSPAPQHKRRGRFASRGAFPRGSPRGRGRRDTNFDRLGPLRRRFSRSPVRGRGKTRPSPRGRPMRSPLNEDYSDKDSLYRSPSRDSDHSEHSKLSVSSRGSRKQLDKNSTRSIRSIVNDSARSPSPLRRIPSFDADDASLREGFPMHGMRASDARVNQRFHPVKSNVGTGQYATSPPYAASVGSYYGSPRSPSPYSSGRGSWGGKPQYHGQHG